MCCPLVAESGWTATQETDGKTCWHTMGLYRKDGGKAIHREFTLPALSLSDLSKCTPSSQIKHYIKLPSDNDIKYKQFLKTVLSCLRGASGWEHLGLSQYVCELLIQGLVNFRKLWEIFINNSFYMMKKLSLNFFILLWIKKE